ncbi:haloacid dehalogenase superfamily, subfamily IA, variant 1 with third motif having Dx(3-4)D or Dx(3-4)E [Streptomyces sp. MnatMP-M17]|nr:haloacid dehalogenase superfamily, subfamily IA, variant 1 with third motif having Dx(3-4)D or Dx(3-4)E [Streptomyces sp. MnatMP-M17]
MIETIVFDVGETLVRDDRYWASWADWLGIPRHTISALVGAATVQNKDNADALRLIKPGMDIGEANRAREAAGRGEHLDESDLYPDVRPALAGLQALGIRVVLAGNQTVKAGDLLRRLDLPADLVATSAEWGVAKPAPEFFGHVIEAARAAPDRTVYVGDHPAYDLFPAQRAGLRTAHLRRGPWGYLWADDPEVVEAADWRIDSLTQLTSIAAAIPPD